MVPVLLKKFTAVTALGRGATRTLEALETYRSGLMPYDFEGSPLETFIGRVEGLESIIVSGTMERFDCRNNRLALLCLQQDGFENAVAELRRRYGAHRIAVLMGTSTSGILEVEHAYQRRDSQTGALPHWFQKRSRFTNSMFSLAEFVREYLQLEGPASVTSTACSSSAKVFASAARLIAAGVCEAAVVGGVDSLCLNTIHGFSSLEVVSSMPCRPFDAERDGLTLGEGAGFALLQKIDGETAPGSLALLGYGESSDGYHMSHPHPEGHGAILAMHAALTRAKVVPEKVDYVNLHGTATRTNDTIEDLAVNEVFGTAVPCSSTKGWTGHTLGAAGAIESVIACLCIQHGLMPGTLNTKNPDPNLKTQLLVTNRRQKVEKVLSNFFGFGGSNCSLIFGAV